MITKQDKFRLKQEFPEGIPAWMWERGYDADKVRKLMKGRRRVFPSTIDGTEHDFSGDLENWEDRVFEHASHFTVVQGRSPFTRVRTEYKTFPEARVIAEMSGITAMVYAVTESGRHVMLIRRRWPHYEQLWKQKTETRA